MTFTASNLSELIRLLETQPKLLWDLRRVLFPEIDVQKTLQELAEAQRRTEATVERLGTRIEAGFVDAAAARVAGFAEVAVERQRIETKMEAGFAEASAERQRIEVKVDAGFAGASAERQRIEAEMEAGFAGASADRKEMKRDLGRLKGLTHEQFYRDRAVGLFGRHLKQGHDATESIADKLHAAYAAGQISEHEYTQVMATDLLWSGQLRDIGEQVTLVVEASWLAEARDVERAVTRANVLRRIDVKAVPVISGHEWAAGVSEMALEMHAVVVENGRIDPDSWQAALSNWMQE